MSEQIINRECRQLILNVLDYFIREKNNGPLLNIIDVQGRVADALQISYRSVSKISAEIKKCLPLETLSHRLKIGMIKHEFNNLKKVLS